MSWVNLYSADRQPTKAEIAEYIANPLWDEMNDFLRKNYKVEPSYSYSACSGQPGWNIKYQKAGRSLCTLYPMSGYFIALVVIGAKEQVEAASSGDMLVSGGCPPSDKPHSGYVISLND